MLDKQKPRNYFGFDSKSKVIVVGHQPVIFHPGILAKFIAASEVAKQCNAKLVHLVVDHHIGDVGTIEVPKFQNGLLEVQKIRIATCDDTISLCDQKPLKISMNDLQFAETLQNSEQNAAMQIAAATDELMSPYASVHYRVGAKDLLKTPFGKAVLEKMFSNPHSCINAYNNAVQQYPNSGVNLLAENELPLWHGPRNERVTTQRSDLRPRALLLTLLARVSLGDLFVHGTGGASYDLVMEHWSRQWLGIEPCPQVMATATMKLLHEVQNVEEARAIYFSGDSNKKYALLEKINLLPRKSAARRIAYLELHRMYASCNEKPNHKKLLATKHIANKRDWAFPLYSPHQLQMLTTNP